MKVTLLHPFVGGGLQTHRFGMGHLGLGYIGACCSRRATQSACWMPERGDHRRRSSASCRGVPSGHLRSDCDDSRNPCGGERLQGRKRDQRGVPDCCRGPHASALPEQTFVEFPSIDVAVMGEGQTTMCELAMVSTADRKTAAFEGFSGSHSGPVIQCTVMRVVHGLRTWMRCRFQRGICFRASGGPSLRAVAAPLVVPSVNACSAGACVFGVSTM